jgi:tellurite resistance protein TehA-like permease
MSSSEERNKFTSFFALKLISCMLFLEQNTESYYVVLFCFTLFAFKLLVLMWFGIIYQFYNNNNNNNNNNNAAIFESRYMTWITSKND